MSEPQSPIPMDTLVPHSRSIKLEDLLSWNSIGWWVAILVGVWGALMGTGDYDVANVFFAFAVVLFVIQLGKATGVLRRPTTIRIVLFSLGAICAVIVFVIVMRWTKHKASEAENQRQQLGRLGLIPNLNLSVATLQKELQDSRLDNAKSTAFLSGQVTVLTQLTANPPRNPDVKSAADALRTLAAAKPMERDESVTELRREGADLSRRLREFQKNMDDENNRNWESERQQMRNIPTADKDARDKVWQQTTTVEMQSYTRNRAEFEPLRAEVVAFREKMIRKLPAPPPEDQLLRRLLIGAGLAGPSGAANIAVYVDSLVAMLPLVDQPEAKPQR
ncbi:MAG TPA: hypothetical protein VLM42_17635 [Bryobacteraceae bacterium]|nr:hypothetical protein [Bryobacteraceae bacterium]